MFNQNRIFRLFQLINYLKSRPSKSIRAISSFLETSDRTAYRYIDLLKDLGFNIEKDTSNRYGILSVEGLEMIPFTAQEADFLQKLLRTAGKSNKLTAGIVEKIKNSGELQYTADAMFKVHLGKMVDLISSAIVENRQIILKGYHSANSETISDRKVEPVCFTDDYNSISAYEIKSKENKYFNIERITDVIVLDSMMQFEKAHKFFKPDVFGFQGKSLTKEIELILSMRAAIYLREEFPMSNTFLKKIDGKNKYRFKAKVQDFKGPARFVKGFESEITLVGSEEFIKFLKRKSA